MIAEYIFAATTIGSILNDISEKSLNSGDTVVEQRAPQKAQTFLKKINESLSKIYTNIELEEQDNSTLIRVKWSFSHQLITANLSREFPQYYGEIKDIEIKNKLFFKEAPLGQNNGAAFKITENSTDQWLTENFYQHYSVFLNVKYKDFSKLIPIITTASENECGSSVFELPKKFLCIQTSNPGKKELSTHFKDGFSNELKINEIIKDKNEITTTVEVYYKGEKI